MVSGILQQLTKIMEEKRQTLISNIVTKGLDPNIQMEDSGIDWLGKIPKHWKIEPLKYHVNVNTKALSEYTPENTLLYYIDIGSVNSNGTVLEPEILTFGEAPSRARRVISAGDTIVSTVRTYLKAIAYFPHLQHNLICSTGFAVLTPRKRLFPKFLYYLMRSTQFVDNIMAHSVGVSYPAINASEMGRFPCLLPPTIEEQKEIAGFLDKEITKIDLLTKLETDQEM